MRLAANTLVVIILGIVLVGAGIYFLQEVISAGEQAQESLSDDERDLILQNMPSDREVYLYEDSRDIVDSTVTVPVGLYNRFQTNITPTFTVTCVSCGGSTMSFTTAGENVVPPGERRVILGILSNESWGPQQYVMSLNVSNETGPHLGSTTFRVSR